MSIVKRIDAEIEKFHAITRDYSGVEQKEQVVAQVCGATVVPAVEEAGIFGWVQMAETEVRDG